MKQKKIFFNGNNWVIKEKVDLEFLNTANSIIDKFCQNQTPLKKNSNNTKVLERSTTGILSNQYAIQKSLASEEMIIFMKEYQNICEKISKDYCVIMKDLYFSWKVAWTVVGGMGGFHTLHDHDVLDNICSVLYLKCGKEISSPFGETYFILDANCRNKNLINFEKKVTISPSEGDLLLFPSHILHGTYPQTSELRQTLNVDFEICNKKSEYIKYK